MKQFLLTSLALALAAGNALAQNNNPCPGDKEYQFNIIGTKDKKNAVMENNGHRIFVDLDGPSKIYFTGDTAPATPGLQCGNKFDVLDANATDTDGGTILVPCDPLTADNLDPSVCFSVWATPLGKAGSGPATIDVRCAFDAETCIGCNIDGGDCALGTDEFLLAHNGKPVKQNITNLFRASGCIDVVDDDVCGPGDISFNNEWIFNIEQLLYYYWDYDANGNRIVNVRFCDAEGVEGFDCGGGTQL